MSSAEVFEAGAAQGVPGEEVAYLFFQRAPVRLRPSLQGGARPIIDIAHGDGGHDWRARL